MNLLLDGRLAEQYHSGSQKARVLTESWVQHNLFCPRCGNNNIIKFTNNRPVADFFCPKCKGQYELKSKNGKFGAKVSDGSYETIIARITGNENPDFLFLCYSLHDMSVKELIMIPKYFFVPDIIEQRSPLSPSAHRAGWVGCNILLNKIPHQGKIKMISEGKAEDRTRVLERVRISQSLETHNLTARGWLMDVLNCVNILPSPEFTLKDMYAFEATLSEKHPENRHIRPKIRQQLQVLRDKGFILFLEAGKYRKVTL